MKIEQIYTGCLAQGAYYIESNGEAVIIDPLRETQPYMDRAQQSGATIKYVLETHFHADFVSGHLDLGKKTGAPIVFGPNANPQFEAHIATDGEVLKVGKVTITTGASSTAGGLVEITGGSTSSSTAAGGAVAVTTGAAKAKLAAAIALIPPLWHRLMRPHLARIAPRPGDPQA